MKCEYEIPFMWTPKISTIAFPIIRPYVPPINLEKNRNINMVWKKEIHIRNDKENYPPRTQREFEYPPIDHGISLNG